EVVTVDVDELPLLHPDLLAVRVLQLVAGEIGHHPDDERQLLHLERAAGLDIVGEVDAWLADLVYVVLRASTLRHRVTPRAARAGRFGGDADRRHIGVGLYVNVSIAVKDRSQAGLPTGMPRA